MDTTIQLGDFIFKDLEIPEKINFGGAQQLAQHDLIGGARVIDSLGKNDTDISWSGLMTGSDALARSQQLNKMRGDGRQLKLKWFNLNYDVVIQSFEAQTERFYQVTYTISLRVINDSTTPVLPQNLIGFNEAINNDYQQAETISQLIVDPAIQSALSTLGTAIGNVQTFNGASPATIATITNPLNGVIDAVTAALREVQIAIFGDSTGTL